MQIRMNMMSDKWLEKMVETKCLCVLQGKQFFIPALFFIIFDIFKSFIMVYYL
jgi:hypothetical protein